MATSTYSSLPSPWRLRALACLAVLAASTESPPLADTLKQAQELVKGEAKRMAEELVREHGKRTDINGTKLAAMFRNAFAFTASNSWKLFPDDDTIFTTTGDIKQMWLRDSSAQMMPYVSLAAQQPEGSPLRQIMEKAMLRQVRFILDDSYSSAFYIQHGDGAQEGPNKNECPPAQNCPNCQCKVCAPKCGDYTYQQDFELDSLFFPLLLHHRYWRATGSTRHLTAELTQALKDIVHVCRVEQWHNRDSPYYYKPLKGSFKDGLGLIWSFALPSDDQAGPGYNIPENILAVVGLRKGAELAAGPLNDAALAKELTDLAKEVHEAVLTHGVVRDTDDVEVFAYQVDGNGGHTLMDDANTPNLLWLPYLGFDEEEEVYEHTRKLILSARNTNYFSGKVASGLGSHHATTGLRPLHPGPQCYSRCIWHLGLIVQGITSKDEAEKLRCMQYVLASDGGQLLLHEGFSPDDATHYNRDWFGWANAMFSEWVLSEWAGKPGTPARPGQQPEGTSQLEAGGQPAEEPRKASACESSPFCTPGLGRWLQSAGLLLV